MPRFLVTPVLLLAWACAGPGADPGEAEAAAASRKILEREAVLAEPALVEGPDGSFRAHVPGRLVGEWERQGSGHYARFDFGAPAPAHCHVMDDDKSVALTLAGVSDDYHDIVGSQHYRRVSSTHVGVAGSHPYLGIHWFVVIDGGTHEAKLRLGNHGDHALYCLHSQSGYRVSFDRFFAGFLASLEVSGPPPAAFRETRLLRFGSQGVGYRTLEIRAGANDTWSIETRHELLEPADEVALRTQETYELETARDDGTLLESLLILRDGPLQYRIELSETAAGSWTIRGSSDAATVERRFEAEGPLLSTLGEYRLLRAAARGELATPAPYERWIGAIQPDGASPHSLDVTGPARVRIESGPVGLTAEVDEHGPVRGRLRRGSLELELERAHVEGDF